MILKLATANLISDANGQQKKPFNSSFMYSSLSQKRCQPHVLVVEEELVMLEGCLKIAVDRQAVNHTNTQCTLKNGSISITFDKTVSCKTVFLCTKSNIPGLLQLFLSSQMFYLLWSDFGVLLFQRCIQVQRM